MGIWKFHSLLQLNEELACHHNCCEKSYYKYHKIFKQKEYIRSSNKMEISKV